MIGEFNVSNYLSINKTLTVSFYSTKKRQNGDEYVKTMKDEKRVMRVAIIHGNSATGKSAITKAMEMFFYLMNHNPSSPDEKIGHKPFLLDEKSPKKPCEMSMVFYIDTEKYSMKLIFDDEKIIEEKLSSFVKKRAATVYRRYFVSNKTPRKVEFGDQWKLSAVDKEVIRKLLTNNRTLMATYDMAINEDTSIMKKVRNYMHSFLGRFTSVNTLLDYATNLLANDKDGKLKEYLNTMLKVVKANINSVELKKNENKTELFFVHSGNGRTMSIKQEDESKGVMRFLGMMALIYKQKETPSFVIIDDLDKELHPDMRLFYFLYFLCNTNGYSQLLFTTHTFFLLDKSNIIRRDAIWYTKHDDKNETILTRPNEANLPGNKSLTNYYEEGNLVALNFLHTKNLTIDEFKKLWEDELKKIKVNTRKEENKDKK